MIVAADTDGKKYQAAMFLREHGVNVPLSEDFNALGRLVNGELVGVVAYNGFSGKTCWMHTAGKTKHWLCKELLKLSFEYPFEQLDIEYLFACVNGNNPHALQFDLKVGFKPYDVLENGWKPGVAMHILRMTRNECKWIKQPDERKVANG